MAHTSRKTASNTTCEAEKFLDEKNLMTMNARIDGLETVQLVQQYLKWEHEHQARDHVIERLEGRMRSVRPRQ